MGNCLDRANYLTSFSAIFFLSQKCALRKNKFSSSSVCEPRSLYLILSCNNNKNFITYRWVVNQRRILRNTETEVKNISDFFRFSFPATVFYSDFFLNLKHVNSNNPKVKVVTCCNIINQTYYIFPLNN